MAWTAPSHYLNQCWNIVNWALGNKHQWNLNRILYIFIQENVFEILILEWRSFCLGLNVLRQKAATATISHRVDNRHKCVHYKTKLYEIILKYCWLAFTVFEWGLVCNMHIIGTRISNYILHYRINNDSFPMPCTGTYMLSECNLSVNLVLSCIRQKIGLKQGHWYGNIMMQEEVAVVLTYLSLDQMAPQL